MAKAQEKAGSSALSGLAKFNPTWATQPRQPEGAPDGTGGQFASEADDANASPELANAPVTDVDAEKRGFVDQY